MYVEGEELHVRVSSNDEGWASYKFGGSACRNSLSDTKLERLALKWRLSTRGKTERGDTASVGGIANDNRKKYIVLSGNRINWRSCSLLGSGISS